MIEKAGNLGTVPLEKNGGVPVNLQDQTSPPVIFYLNQKTGESTLAAPTVINTYTITVTDATTFIVDRYVGLYNIQNQRVYSGIILSVAGNVLTMNNPLNFAYQSGDFIASGIINMNVNGSVTPQIFSLRVTTPPLLRAVVDITRINYLIKTNTAVSLSDFGDITNGLARGCLLRKTNDEILNIYNIRDNSRFLQLSGIDWVPFSAANPGTDIYGCACRITFAGQNKMGVVIRVEPGEDIEFLIQDDLTSLIEFTALIEGHVVTN